jgi:Nickel/cobalt transporter regulator
MSHGHRLQSCGMAPKRIASMRMRMILAILLASTLVSPALAQEEPIERGDIAQRPESMGQRGGWQRREAPPQQIPQAQAQPQAQLIPAPAAPPQPDWSGNRGGNNGGWQRPDPMPSVAQSTPAPASQPPMRGEWRRPGGWQNNDGGREGWRGARPDGGGDGGRDRGGWNRGGNGNTGVVPPPPPQPNVDVHRGGNVGQWGGNWNGRNWDRNGDGRPDWRTRDRDRDGTPNWRDRDRDGDGVRNNRDWDRNNNGTVDRRWDRNNNGTVDRHYDWNRDGVRDNRYGWNNRGNDWNREWRNDRRYDWQRYRWSNRNQFRLPRYYAPYGYGYGYQRFGIGIYLDNVFFGSRYRISDPWRYRLPEARWPYQWVRYYDDVLLVDTRSGYVVDVIYDFFW